MPPLIIISVISMFYTAFRSNRIVSAVLKGMQAGVAAVIADVVLSLGGKIVKSKDLIAVLLMLCSFIATFVFKINVMYIILVCGCIGAVRILINIKKEKQKGGEKK